MISLKKYLDMRAALPPPEVPEAVPAPPRPEPESEPNPLDHLPAAAVECYRSALLSIGRNAVKGCPTLGADLESGFQHLEQTHAANPAAGFVQETESQVEALLEEWGERTAAHFKANEVKEILIALAKTAESVGDRDHRYASQFADLTVHLQEIGDLDNLTQIRSSLVRRVKEQKESVDQMTRESVQLVTQLSRG